MPGDGESPNEVASEPAASNAANLTDELPASTTSNVAVILAAWRADPDSLDGMQASIEKLGGK